jgi:hypothetical protein
MIARNNGSGFLGKAGHLAIYRLINGNLKNWIVIFKRDN